MTVAKQIKEVAGWLNAAGHDLRRAVLAGRAIGEKDGHDLAQLECAVALTAQAWNNRAQAAGVKPLVWRDRKWDR